MITKKNDSKLPDPFRVFITPNDFQIMGLQTKILLSPALFLFFYKKQSKLSEYV